MPAEAGDHEDQNPSSPLTNFLDSVEDAYASSGVVSLERPSGRTDPASVAPLEPLVALEQENQSVHWTGTSYDRESGYTAFFSDGTERRWSEATGSVEHSEGRALITQDDAVAYWFTADRDAPRVALFEETSVTAASFVIGAELIVIGCADGRVIVRSADPSVPDRVLRTPSPVTGVQAVSEQALLSFIHSEDETLLWRVDGPDDPIPIDASDHQAAKPGSYQSLNFPHGYDRMWLAVDGLCALGLAHAPWQSRQSFSLWVADGDPRHRFAKFDGVVTDAYDGGPRLAVTVTGGRRVHLWNFDRAGGPQELVNDEAADVTKAWFSAEGGRVFVATMRGKLWVTRTDSVQRPLLLEGHSAPVRSAVVAPDGRWMLTTGEDKAGIRWSLEGAGRLVARRDLGQCYLDLVLSPDASRVAGWIESNQWQRGLPDVGVWNTSLDSSPLLVRPGATESDDSRASQSKAFDDSGDRLILRKGGTTQTWPITWRSLQDRLWELEPTNPSLDERQALLGYLPVVKEYPKE